MGSGVEPSRKVVNREQPARVPVKPMGSVDVIVRVQWSDGVEEWRPARAVRWTPTHVMAGWHEELPSGLRERREWLRAGEVMRSVSWLVPPERPPRSSAERDS